jgi:hypothetical protein
MKSDLNATFQSWLDDVLAHHADVVKQELGNRFDEYPLLQECLTARPVDMTCLRERIDQPSVVAVSSFLKRAHTEYSRLLDDSPSVQQKIAQLIDYLPDEADALIERINRFVGQGKERSGSRPDHVLSVAALILTLAHPDRFVDFPSFSTWEEFAQALGYGVVAKQAEHGEKLLWASTFAGKLAATPAFGQRWKREADRAMWVISALNWAHKLVSKNASGETG